MWSTLLFGAVASSALVIGAVIGVRFQLPKRLLAMLLAFAAGALITALSFELFEDAYERGGIWLAAIGLFVGAIVFTVLSALLDRWAQPGSKPKPADEYRGSVKLDTDAAAADRPATAASTRGAAGLALLAAATLDGVPESLALGISLTEGTGGIALLAASSSRICPKRWWALRRCGNRAARPDRSSDSGPLARQWSPSR